MPERFVVGSRSDPLEHVEEDALSLESGVDVPCQTVALKKSVAKKVVKIVVKSPNQFYRLFL